MHLLFVVSCYSVRFCSFWLCLYCVILLGSLFPFKIIEISHWQRRSDNMQAQIGRVGEFDQKLESWEQYAERLGHFLDANSIQDATKKRSVFLSVIGLTTYKLLASLIAPDKPGDKEYEELVKVLKEYHNPAPSEIVQT